MGKEKSEREKLRDEINKLIEKRDEYFDWLRNNLDSPRWSEMKTYFNDIVFKIQTLRERQDHLVSKNIKHNY